MGKVKEALGSVFGSVFSSPNIKTPKIDYSSFQQKKKDMTPQPEGVSKEALDRIRRMKAARGRSSMRVDLAEYSTGAGIQIRGQ